MGKAAHERFQVMQGEFKAMKLLIETQTKALTHITGLLLAKPTALMAESSGQYPFPVKDRKLHLMFTRNDSSSTHKSS
jgi:hypothetical protein